MEWNAVIVVGDLGGIRKDNDKGRYVNNKVHKMPFARLLNYIEYKAHDAGIAVQLVEEYDTSRRATGVPARVSERRRDALSVPSVGWTTTRTRTVR